MLEIEDLKSTLSELGPAQATAIVRLEGGTGRVFRIDLDDGTALVLKDFDQKKTLPAHDAFVAGLLADAGLPVTRYLLVDESCRRLPFPFSLTNHLPGRPVTDYASHPNYRDLFRQIGALARRLHEIRTTNFGVFPEPEHKHNASYVRGLAGYAFERFLHYGGDVELSHKLSAIFERDFATIVPPTRRAAFAHDDLHPGNILATETDAGLTISGLIDFGNARASAPVMDLAKTIFICEHMAPGCGPIVLDGYGPIDHPTPEAALAFYTMLHRIIMWWWLRHIGVLTADAQSDLIDALQATAAGS